MAARTVVTGGLGYIGRHVVSRLQESGCDVVPIARARKGRGNAALAATVTIADVRDAAAIEQVFRQRDVIIHLACLAVGPSRSNPADDFAVNAAGTFNVLEAARRVGVGRVVVVSSAEVYGTSGGSPISEDHPLLPTSPYGASKASCDLYARVYRTLFGIDAVVLRLFNVFGPAADGSERGTVETVFARNAAIGAPLAINVHPDTMRDFIFVQDAVSAIVKCASGHGSELAYNIGSGVPTSLAEIAIAAGYPPSAIPERKGSPPIPTRANIALARRDLGLKPTCTVLDYVRDLANQLRASDVAG